MEYHLLTQYYRTGIPINYSLIEAISLNSDNPAFKTARFRLALIAYRRFGNRPLRKTGWSLKDAVYYAKNSYHIHEAIKNGGASV